MKYKEIYAALNQRRQEVPGFSYSDYSGWRCLEQSSATLPLWVEAEDPVHHRRFIFKHYGIMIQTIIIDCDTHTEQRFYIAGAMTWGLICWPYFKANCLPLLHGPRHGVRNAIFSRTKDRIYKEGGC